MTLRVFLTALAIAATSLPGAAQARAQATLVCRMQNGSTQPANAQTMAPLMVTGQGQSTSQSVASSKSIQDWGNRAGGPEWSGWNAAARKNTNCTSTKQGFQWLYSCRATAQPCK